MNSIKRDRNLSMSPTNAYYYSSSPKQNGKVNGSRQRTNSSPHPYTLNGNKKEKGVIEKLLNSYGFVECSSTGNRVFFHYSEYQGDPNQLLIGDCLEFKLTNDPRNNKLLAVELSKLPPGSVVIETLSDEIGMGRVEVEPKIAKNGEMNDPSLFGRVSYDKNGEFFFLPFSYNDIESGESIRKGDTVQFSIATNKRTGSLKARKIRYANTNSMRQTEPTYGIISSLKDSFGFIERADIVAEIFFHYSEYAGEVNELMIGDDVQFQLQNRQGKEIAVQVRKLDPGTVVFEDISHERYKGHVIKAINNRPLNSSMDGHLTGMIEYQGANDTHEVLFGDRDTEDDIILQKGDIVEFNVSTDRRDKLQRAVHIKLISVCLKEGQKREFGVVSSLKEGFGFIKCVHQDISIFFHFSEVLEQSHIISVGDEVEFTIETDQISRRQHATRIRFLPKGSVSFETISPTRHIGVIEQEARERSMKSPSKNIKDQEYGVIKCFLNGEETDIFYRLRDCRPRDFPHYRDKVEFTLVTKKSTNQNYARDVAIIEVHENEFVKGYICALKEKFGFIEAENGDHEVFFHYSEFDGDPNELDLGDEVRYMKTKKSEKPSAEKVTKIAGNKNFNSSLIVKDENVSPKVYEGIVMEKTNDDNEDGYIQLTNGYNGGGNDEKASQDDIYPFNMSALLDKKDVTPPNTKVSFQIQTDDGIKRAVNIVSKRSEKKGKIESVKGQFGFISYDSEDGRSIFFHISEVIDDHGTDLQPGNEVRFFVVRSHRNAKKSAIRLHKIRDERPEHLSRRRSQKFSECTTNNKFGVVRQPYGPDGSNGFKLERPIENVLKEQISAIDISA